MNTEKKRDGPNDIEIDYQNSWGKILMEPLVHITQTSINPTWSTLATVFNHWLNVSEDIFKVINDSMQLYRNGDLLYEDIYNESSWRDKIQTAHNVHGLPFTLSTYHYAFFNSIAAIFKLKNQTVMVFKEQMEEICRSRLMELKWRQATICPTIDEYIHMVTKKTCGLFTMQIKFMQQFSVNKTDLVKLSAIFGLYFQILDDFQRLTTIDCNSDKYCEDITIGRFSFPVIHAFNNCPTNKKDMIIRIMRQRTKNKELKKYIIKLLNECDSFHYTTRVLQKLKEDALNEMQKLGKNTLMEDFITKHFNNTNTVCWDNLDNNKKEDDIVFQCIKDDLEAMDKELLEPFNFLVSSPERGDAGDQLVKRLGTALDVSDENVKKVLDIAAYAHEVVFLLDDIQDNSLLRRGLPVSCSVYGTAFTINTVNYIYARILARVAYLDPKIINPYMQYMIRLCIGQGMEIYWRDHHRCPTDEELNQMIIYKSSNALLTTTTLLELLSPRDVDTSMFITTLGIYLQVNDDYQNLTNPLYFEKKGFADDVSEGKFSFTIAHAINSHPKIGQLIMDILRQRTRDVQLKKRCISLIEKCGSLDYTAKRIKELEELVRKQGVVLGDGPASTDFIDLFFKYHEHWVAS